jgi:hypothetical protein
MNRGAVYISGGSAEISDSRFEACSNNSDGGAVYISSTAVTGTTVETRDTVFDDVWTSNGRGGAVSAEVSGNIRVSGVSIKHAKTTDSSVQGYGGGAYLYSSSGQIQVLEDTVIEDTQASSYGGGLVATGYAGVTISGVHIKNTTLTGSGLGGGAYLQSVSGATRVFDTVIEDAEASGAGGLYVHQPGDITLSGVHIIDARATTGSAGGAYLRSFSGKVHVLEDTVIEDSVAAAGGGGGLMASGTAGVTLSGVHIKNTKVTGSSGLGGGAHLSSTSSGEIRVHDTVIEDAEAATGGGLYFLGSNNRIVLSDLTIKNSHATSNGGGLYAWSIGSLEISESTFEDCRAESSYGGFYISATSSKIEYTDFIDCFAYGMFDIGAAQGPLQFFECSFTDTGAHFYESTGIHVNVIQGSSFENCSFNNIKTNSTFSTTLIHFPLIVKNTVFNTVLDANIHAIWAYGGFDLDGVEFSATADPSTMMINGSAYTFRIKLSTCTVGGFTLPFAAWDALTDKTNGAVLSWY